MWRLELFEEHFVHIRAAELFSPLVLIENPVAAALFASVASVVASVVAAVIFVSAVAVFGAVVACARVLRAAAAGELEEEKRVLVFGWAAMGDFHSTGFHYSKG